MVGRTKTKVFKQYRPDGKGDWISGLTDKETGQTARRVPYRLPKVIAADTVHIVEGEKDVHTIEKLGLVGTTSPGGGESWQAKYGYAAYFKDKHVVVVPDQDEKGAKYRDSVCKDLYGTAVLICVVNVPAGKDITDWIATGATRADLDNLVSLATPYEPSQPVETPSNKRNTKFNVREDGVYGRIQVDGEDRWIRICSKLEVTALARNEDGENWERVVSFKCRDEKPREEMIDDAHLFMKGQEFLAPLIKSGLWISDEPQAVALLERYLKASLPDKRRRTVSEVGWHDNLFVLPGRVIGQQSGEEIIFKHSGDHNYRVSGSLQDWQTRVAAPCVGNSRLVLAVSAAFAGPLMPLLKQQTVGFHFQGGCSLGKTTALHVGASVHGGSNKKLGFLDSWNTTANALEITASSHNHGLLALDELREADPKQVQQMIYTLGNGRGKQRMTKNIEARKGFDWSLIYISSGELSLKQHAKSDSRSGVVKGGAGVRLIEIPADTKSGMGMFEDVHGIEAPRFAEELTLAALSCYGTALDAWLSVLVARRASVLKAVEASIEAFVKAHGKGLSPEPGRVLRSFAVVAAAGEAATLEGITGWQPGEATKAALRCFNDWLAERGTDGASDTEAGVQQVILFMQQHGASRFPPISGYQRENFDGGQIAPPTTYNRAGYRDEGEFLIYPAVFEEICNGQNGKNVARELAARGFLAANGPNLKRVRALPEGLTRVYVLKESILRESSEVLDEEDLAA